MKNRLVIYLALLALPATCAADDFTRTAAQRTEIGDQPYVLPQRGNIPKIIYGTDDRLDVYQVSDAGRLQQAASTCGLLNATNVTPSAGNTFNITLRSYIQLGRPPCADEPFANQPVAAFCTGFLVGPDLIATAGHCYNTPDLSATRFVFGLKMTNSTTPVSTVNANQVYQGTAIVGRALVGDLDYAVIRLDRAVTSPGAVVQSLRRKGTPAVSTSIGVIGHPGGLPTKIAFGSNTRITQDRNSSIFMVNTDTYGGNSGSPIFNTATSEIEGILVTGDRDYESDGPCFRSNIVADSPGREGVSRTSQFTNLIPGITTDADTYGAEAIIYISVVEDNLPTSGFVVAVTATGGDSETVLVSDPDDDNVYTGSISMGTSAGPASPFNNILETTDAGIITVTYSDANAGASIPMTFTDTATAAFEFTSADNWQLY